MRVGIIGLGLIGGSMAIDLKRRGFADEVIGVEADAVNAAAALKIGLVDRVSMSVSKLRIWWCWQCRWGRLSGCSLRFWTALTKGVTLQRS